METVAEEEKSSSSRTEESTHRRRLTSLPDLFSPTTKNGSPDRDKKAKSCEKKKAASQVEKKLCPQLGTKGRSNLWKNLIESSFTLLPTGELLERIEPQNASKYRADFSSHDYRELAESFELNDRQIKESVEVGLALAREQKTSLTMFELYRAACAVGGEDAIAMNSKVLSQQIAQRRNGEVQVHEAIYEEDYSSPARGKTALKQKEEEEIATRRKQRQRSNSV
ncbi:hypothetical protein FRACYDRAFT_249101 [Fragilariopsis cylindrus CCMP1102]|uniref:Uncharacterized protein n=1 Tax=Fragilariopsis cylindrus CCMP1102 TaxID=635003 RepID=A0A1E7ETI0_9STRA|nr:hypothetical protein FRACYDRAFT_249101 [Fragilariopsis cylindrus CCMP1102]|eukprot:OEU09182.1 hypothetical protein FRACYDRAFT_249101 [Fragilariopsis cylindrus CCMP1102]